MKPSGSKDEVALSVKALTVAYGSIEAVRGVDLRVKFGEVVALVGPNGAGKSSTLNAIMGLVRSRGAITFNNMSIAGWAPERIVKAGMTLVPEGRHVFATLTVEENLRIGSATRRERGDSLEPDELLEWFPVLKARRGQFAGTLSGGEQQQLAIARALKSKPSVLLLDEPSLGLAPKIVDDLFEKVEGLRSHGTTILMVEQNVRRALEIADHAYVLVTGEIRAEGSSTDLRATDAVEVAYFGSHEVAA